MLIFRFALLLLIIPISLRAVQLQKVCEGLQQPTFAVVEPFVPGKIFVVEQKGRIVTCDAAGKVSEFLNMKSRVTAGGEMGLLSMAFHPRYKENKRFFVYYTTEQAGSRVNVVAEISAKDFSEKRLLVVTQPYSNHDGGQLAFDSKGLLYIGKGDGGAGYDPHGNGQDKNSLLAKILRIDVDHADPKRKTEYSIPSDNPFAKGGGAPEIYAYGIRNPWRFSFDTVTGLLWLADVGQDKWEEIDIVEKGANYGWKEMEGMHCLPTLPKCKTEGMTEPIFEYSHDVGQSITGGYVYRGKKIPELVGKYIYGDYVSGHIWALTWDSKHPKVVGNQELMKKDLEISSFGLDRDGEILVVSLKGTLYRLVP